MNVILTFKHHPGGSNPPILDRFWLLFKRERLYEEIEPAIKPLVDSINAVRSLCTIASCQGHWCGKPPYVYFKGPARVAGLIERQLREEAMSGQSMLNANWCVVGIFNGDYNQAFLLHAPDYHQNASHLFQPIWFFGIRRKRLNAEILRMSYLVEQTMISNSGDNNKPKIHDSASHN